MVIRDSKPSHCIMPRTTAIGTVAIALVIFAVYRVHCASAGGSSEMGIVTASDKAALCLRRAMKQAMLPTTIWLAPMNFANTFGQNKDHHSADVSGGQPLAGHIVM